MEYFSSVLGGRLRSSRDGCSCCFGCPCTGKRCVCGWLAVSVSLCQDHSKGPKGDSVIIDHRITVLTLTEYWMGRYSEHRITNSFQLLQ